MAYVRPEGSGVVNSGNSKRVHSTDSIAESIIDDDIVGFKVVDERILDLVVIKAVAP